MKKKSLEATHHWRQKQKKIIRVTPLEAKKKTFTLVTPASCEKTFQSHWRQKNKKNH
jgi:hypothetical protein